MALPAVHARGSPDSIPRRNHSTRCAERAVREALGHHAAGGHFLQTIVANRRGGAQRFVGVARFELDAARVEPAVLRRGMAPDAREAVGLQLESDRRAVGPGLAIARRPPVQPQSGSARDDRSRA